MAVAYRARAGGSPGEAPIARDAGPANASYRGLIVTTTTQPPGRPCPRGASVGRLVGLALHLVGPDRHRALVALLRSVRPPRPAHIPRDPAAIYRLYSDDFAYVSASRTLPRTIANCSCRTTRTSCPAWRLLTWALVAWGGSLENLPAVLAEAAYGILVGRDAADRPAGCARDGPRPPWGWPPWSGWERRR